MKDKKLVVLGVTGSIAAYKACELAGLLKKEGFEVQVLLTENAKEFITPLTLTTISGNKAISGMFETPEEWDPVHISIADRAAIVLIAPATASVIGKLASGICDDILTCVTYATKAPVLIAPAMNTNMYRHPITQENISKLKKAGYNFIGPCEGKLACGAEGLGRLEQPAGIVKAVKRLAK